MNARIPIGLTPAIAVVLILITGCGATTQNPSRSGATGARADTTNIEVREGTKLAFDLSPDGRTIVFDLLGQLWLLPIEGGEARSLTDAVRDMADDLEGIAAYATF